ncbi:hypothetical protein Y032_0004g1843 [Ancylostoma ceylanicum]|nr:hypothetical protein Y032_0004g1843 [Ancylostoma ceylanicum]
MAALMYVYMQFLPTPSYFVMIGHVSWMFGHGFPAFIYLLLNRTIQSEVLFFLPFGKDRIWKPRKSSTGTTLSSTQEN